MDFLAPTLDEVKDALAFIDPVCSRGEWAEIAMAIKSEFGEVGFELFDTWSQGSDQYRANDCASTFRSVSSGGGITIATLFGRAREKGYSPQKQQLSEAEREARIAVHAKRQAENARRIEAENAHKKRWQAVLAEASQAVYDLCCDEGTSPYLQRKKVKGYGLRFPRHAFIFEFNESDYSYKIHTDPDDQKAFWASNPKENNIKFRYIKKGVIIVPMRDEAGKLWSFQIIYVLSDDEKKNGKKDKSFIDGCKKSGLFHLIRGSEGSPVVLCEGFATGSSIHMATGWHVFVCFDNHNLKQVAPAARRLFPRAPIIVAGDDDEKEDGTNPGKKSAIEAAKLCGGVVTLPVFEGISSAA